MKQGDQFDKKNLFSDPLIVGTIRLLLALEKYFMRLLFCGLILDEEGFVA